MRPCHSIYNHISASGDIILIWLKVLLYIRVFDDRFKITFRFYENFVIRLYSVILS